MIVVAVEAVVEVDGDSKCFHFPRVFCFKAEFFLEFRCSQDGLTLKRNRRR